MMLSSPDRRSSATGPKNNPPLPATGRPPDSRPAVTNARAIHQAREDIAANIIRSQNSNFAAFLPDRRRQQRIRGTAFCRVVRRNKLAAPAIRITMRTYQPDDRLYCV